MRFLRERWWFWVMAVAVTTVFAFGMSQRYENWWILGVGTPLAVAIALVVEVWSEHKANSPHKGSARDE